MEFLSSLFFLGVSAENGERERVSWFQILWKKCVEEANFKCVRKVTLNSVK